MTLIELLCNPRMAYIDIHPTFSAPSMSLMLSGVSGEFTVWEKGKFTDRKEFATEEEAVTYIKRLMLDDK